MIDEIFENDIDFLITNLKIISIVKINEKMCIRKGHLQIDPDYNSRCIKRWLFNDSRDAVINFISSIIKQINAVIIKVSHFDQTEINWIILRIITDLEKIEIGLGNLKITYNNDQVTIAMIDNLIIKFGELNKKCKKIIYLA
jgi:hypothetical protein